MVINHQTVTIQVSMRNPGYLQVSYHYDPVGRLLDRILSNGAKTSYSYDDDNLLVQMVNTSVNGGLNGLVLFIYEYDDAGNRTAKWGQDDNLLQSYVYDQKNRMSSITVYGATNDTIVFTYDPNDFRIGKSSSIGSRSYLMEGEHFEAVYDDNDNLKAKFFRGVVVDEIVNGYLYDENGKPTN